MKVVVPGGHGQIGVPLVRALHENGHDVVVLSRARRDAPWHVVEWDGRTLDAWAREIDGADAVVNLAGRSVNCRYHPANRREIMDSRIESTRVIGEAIAAASHPPATWLQMSTATIYAHRYDAANDEATGILGGDEPDAPDTWRFSIDVATSWEREAESTPLPDTRLVPTRLAMVMSPEPGGTFDLLLKLVRRGLGGPVGDGRQYLSWVHERDFIAAMTWLLEHDDVHGAVNIASPNPLPQAEFMQVLREAAGVRIGLPATRWMLEVGAFLMRTESELILKSRRVVPGRLLEHGFDFEFPTWPAAARDLCACASSRSRRSRAT